MQERIQRLHVCQKLDLTAAKPLRTAVGAFALARQRLGPELIVGRCPARGLRVEVLGCVFQH